MALPKQVLAVEGWQIWAQCSEWYVHVNDDKSIQPESQDSPVQIVKEVLNALSVAIF